MQQRELGQSGLKVYPWAFGGNVFGWTADERTSFDLLDAFVAGGFNLIDTADVYSRWAPGHEGGESETIIGKWLRRGGRRDKVIIATKVGMEMGPGKKGLAGTYVRRAVEDSLRRLRTDYIDLYQSHEDDPATPFEDTLETYARLIEEGKVRAIGASNFSAERLGGALDASASRGMPAYQSLQPQYNLYDREDYETNLEPLCVARGIGVINYYSLASGFLAGKYRSEADLAKGSRSRAVKAYLNPRGMRILDALDEVANAHGVTPAQVSLAWLVARPSVTAPIASATTLGQLEELRAAVSLKLDAGAMEHLDDASDWR
jgi:aryl-alcohol dehydrogenase-like predicted oxidoreductase